jgi:adenosine deaminase
VELFFDAQMHMNNGIDFDVVINGIYQATLAAFEAFNISSKIILGILRDLSEEAAFDVLKKCVTHQDKIIGIGLNSAEKGHPPQKFERVFTAAREQGFLTVAHAGEEGSADYIWQAINLLKVRRIDHGNHAIDDNEQLAFLKKQQIPLTMCPLSNLKLKVVDDLKNHPAKVFLDKGLMVTINSDDPAYFGGYISENYSALQKALDLSTDDLITIAQNSFNASFITKAQKRAFLGEIDDICDEYSSLTGF